MIMFKAEVDESLCLSFPLRLFPYVIKTVSYWKLWTNRKSIVKNALCLSPNIQEKSKKLKKILRCPLEKIILKKCKKLDVQILQNTVGKKS